MQLESSKTSVPKKQQQVFNFLCKVENYEQLMPESIQKFELLNDKAFVFQLKGMPEIALELKDTQAPGKVILGAKSDKIPFGLTANIDAVSDDKSEVQLFFEGEFNAMMAMMIKKPIQKFIDTLSENIQKKA